MFTLKVETSTGNIITLTQDESNYQVYEIDGLNPPEAQINTSSMAGVDGSKFNSAVLQERNIVLYIKIRGDVETNRLKLYQYFRTKEYCKLYYQNGSRNVYIEGYVESFPVSPFSNNEVAQISILCPNPYFKDLTEIVNDISKVIKKFTFPFSIEIDDPIPFSEIELEKVTDVVNTSESETGLIIETVFLGKVDKFEIRNTVTGEIFILNYSFQEDDQLTINCNKGNKSVRLIRGGKETNLIPYIQKGSTFFQLRIGDNNFSYLADEGKSDQLVSIQFKHYNVYRGV